jgi:hypothetical protein
VAVRSCVFPLFFSVGLFQGKEENKSIFFLFDDNCEFTQINVIVQLQMLGS